MAWEWRDIPELLASPNRYKALSRAWHAWAWVPASPLAGLYRRGVLRGPKVVAVVGSTGKTTTAYALEALLGIARRGRINANFGMHLVGRLAALRPWQKELVLEVGISRTGQMARYASMLRPDVVVVTNVGSDHHPSLGGLEGAFREKSLMVQALAPGGLAVLNGDEPEVRSMAGLTQAEVVLYGLGPQNQVRAEDISLDWPGGSSFTLVAPGVRHRMSLPLLGEHLVLCALAACAVALRLGRSLEEIAEGLRRLRPLPGRMYPVWLSGGVCLLEDHYKGAAETYQAALEFMAKVPAGRKVLLLGAVATPVGSQYLLYKRLGASAGKSADLLLTMGSGSKGLAAGARKAGMAEESIVSCGSSVHRAAWELQRRLKPGDVVLVKGRGDQQLGRVSLLLQGKQVSCAVKQCQWTAISCEECALLKRPHAR